MKKIIISCSLIFGFCLKSHAAIEYFMFEGRINTLSPFEVYDPAVYALSGQNVEFYFSIDSLQSSVVPGFAGGVGFDVNYLGGSLDFDGSVSGWTGNVIEGIFTNLIFEGPGMPKIGILDTGIPCSICGINSWIVGTQLDVFARGLHFGTEVLGSVTLSARQFTPVPLPSAMTFFLLALAPLHLTSKGSIALRAGRANARRCFGR